MLEEIDGLFRELENTTDELDRLVGSGEANIARELIALRRRYSETAARANTLVDEQICNPLRHVPEAAPLLREYHERANEARAMIANHQARWPASSISADEEGYRQSVATLSELHKRNNRWRRHTLLPEAEKLLGRR